MTRHQFVELFANIRSTFVSFFSIVLFVTLGVGLFLGIHGAAVSLQRAAAIAYQDGAFHDIEVVYPYGLDGDDLEAIAATDGVELVVPCYLAYESQMVDGVAHAIVVHSLTDGVDLCEVVEGSLPAAPDEIAVSAGYAEEYGIAPGDRLSLFHDATDEADADGMRYLTCGDFTVSGIVTNPNYLAQSNLMLGMTDMGTNVEAFAYVTEAAFDAQAFGGRYPRALVRATSLAELDPFSDEYRDRADELKNTLVTLGEPRAQARFDAIKAEAQAQIDEAQAQIEEGEAQLAAANAQLEEGEGALLEGRNRIDAAIARLESGQESYATTREQGEQMLATMRNSLNSLQAAHDESAQALATQQANLAELRRQVEEFKAAVDAFAGDTESDIEEMDQIDQETDEQSTEEDRQQRRQEVVDRINERIEDFENKVKSEYPLIAANYPDLVNLPRLSYGTSSDSSGVPDLTDAITMLGGYADGASSMVDEAEEDLRGIEAHLAELSRQLDSGWSQYYDASNRLESSLASAAADIAAGQAQVDEGEATLEEKSKELEEGRKTVEEQSSELDEGRALLDDAREQADSLAYMSWIVSTRSTTSGAIALNNIVNLTNNLRVVMASLFVIVGLLVCYSAISRIVHEQVTQIGTKKAVGFRDGEITASYLAYTLMAVLIGVALGVICSSYVVQGILYPKLAGNFDMPLVGSTNAPLDIALIGVGETLMLLVCTSLACRSVLRRSAIELLAGEQSGNGTTRFYERWKVWKRLPLLTQTMINNCVSDSRRVFATIVGVAGCTALIVTASSLDGNIARSLQRHFGLVYDYDVSVAFDPASEGAQQRMESAVDDLGYAHAAVCSSMYLLEDEGEPAFENIVVPQDGEAFAQLFHLNVVPSPGTAPTQGAWLSQSHAEHRGLNVGDHITVCTVTGARYQLTIAGFFSYYLPSNTIVLSPGYYEDVFGEEATPNTLIVATDGAGAKAMTDVLSPVDGFRSIKDERENVTVYERLFKSVTTPVVGIYMALSALMALIVLLNLDYMFIDEKKRELIVLMINGFSVGDAKAYVYRDSIVMTILGIVLGIALGVVMGTATVRAVEWQSCSFMKGIYLPGCLLGAAMSAVFAVLMMLIALRRIPRFSLTDIARY